LFDFLATFFALIFPRIFHRFARAVEDEKHSDFVHLRQFLTRTHLQDLIETTHYLHYEQFRTRQLLALKEGGGAALAAQQQQNSAASLVASSMPIPPPTNPSPGQ
jgi:hypothetical protein